MCEFCLGHSQNRNAYLRAGAYQSRASLNGELDAKLTKATSAGRKKAPSQRGLYQ